MRTWKFTRKNEIASVGDILRHLVTDALVRQMKWSRAKDGEIRMSTMSIFKEAFLDAYCMDEATLKEMMVKDTEAARQRDRTKVNSQKKRKLDD